MLSTRHPKPSMISFAKVWKSSGMKPAGTGPFWHTNAGLPYTEKFRNFYEKIQNDTSRFTAGQLTALSYGSVIACYLMHKNIYSHIVIYEEMTSNIIAGTRTLFEKLDFPMDYVPETLTALTKHSQNNIFGTSDMNKKG